MSVLCSDAADFRVRRLLAIAAEELPPTLQGRGFTDLAECIDSLSAPGPAICLIDDAVGLPAVSRAVHGLRDRNRRCTCIVLTEHMDPEIHSRFLDYGAAEILLWQDTVDPERAGFNIYRALRGALARTMLSADLGALKQRFDFAWRSSPSPFFRIDGQGQIIQCNQAFAELLGSDSPAEIEGRPLLEMGAGPDANVFPFRAKDSSDGRACFLRNKDGDPVMVELFDHTAPGEHAELRRLARLGGQKYHLPVREGYARPQDAVQVQLRDQLNRYESMYNSLFSGMAEGFILADARGRINAANPAAERTLGLRLADVHGQHIDEVLRPTSCDDADTEFFSQVYDGRERIFELPIDAEDSDRRSAWVRCKACLIGIPGATSVVRRSQFLVSVIDISDQVAAERRASAAELGTKLVQGVSHDMRNYLTAISSSASLMMRLLGEHDASLLEYAKQIEQAAMSSAGLLEQGLRAAKPSREIEDRLVRVDAVISSISVLLRSLCPKRMGLDVELNAEALTVLGQKRSIEQVVINLVLNARQALADGGHIRVSTGETTLTHGNQFGIKPGRAILIEVEDNGPGIEPEIKHRMFEPFFTGRANGSGLGLAMVRELVLDLDGNIVCETEVGSGTRFVVALPFNDKGAPATGQFPHLDVRSGAVTR